MRDELRKYIEIIRIVWYFFRPYKIQVVCVYCSIFIASLFEALNLAVLYPLMNYGLKLETQGFILRQFNKIINLLGGDSLFLSSCILLIIVTVLAILSKYLSSFLQYRLLARIDMAIQKKVIDTYLNADYGFFVKNKQGKLIHTATIAPTYVGNMILYTSRTLNDLTTFGLMVILLIALSWQAAIIVGIIGLGYFLFAKKVIIKLIYRCGLLAVEANREKNVILNELVNGIKPIKVFLSHKFWEEKYHNAVRISVKNQFKMLMGRVFPECFMKAMSYLLLAAIGIFINLITKGNIIPFIPLYGTLALVCIKLSPLASAIGGDLMIFAESLPNTKIIYTLFNEITQKITNGGKCFAELKKHIALRNAWFKYEGTESFLFKGLDLVIDKDKVTAIVGFSGSGKSTLVNLLLRLYELEKGQILIDGVDISEYTTESYLSKIGYVSQETFIYNDTIKENIKFGMAGASDEMIINAAKQANAHEFIVNMMDGYATVVGDSGVKLSGGQRQRIAIARAVLRNPQILILDEATSALDNISEKRVQEAIYNVAQHTTVIIVAHRLSTIQNADKILLLHNGEIAEEGSHDKLFSAKGVYHDLYTRQLAVSGKEESVCEKE